MLKESTTDHISSYRSEFKTEPNEAFGSKSRLFRSKTRILFFIGKLGSGGKERRLIELLSYLNQKPDYEIMVVLTRNIIDYPHFFDLKIKYKVIKKRWRKYDLSVFTTLFKICHEFNPHIVHTWGAIQTLYALPSIILQKITLINSQITSAPPISKTSVISRIINKVNFRFSNVILSNSKAGVEVFKPPFEKTKIVYNGINMNRFINLPSCEIIKSKYKISTPFTVVMVANFSPNKNHLLFFKIAEDVIKERSDITFLVVGGSFQDDLSDEAEYRRLLQLYNDNSHIRITGKVDDVEALVNACDIGVLFSPNGEGISNAILEYMALGKPVIANDAGGTKEIVHHNENGYLIKNENVNEIAALISGLIDDEDKRNKMGSAGKNIIQESFLLLHMGKAFEQVYKEVLHS